MQILFMLSLAAIAILMVVSYRKNRDRVSIMDYVTEQKSGRVLSIQRARRGHPFSDTGRGWWAWRVEWADDAGNHESWALTTREGIKEWRD